MKELKNRILEDGKALNETVLKVDTFLNHQVDSKLMYNMGTYFKEYFKKHGITRILTIESSGIAPTAMTAMQMDLPMVQGSTGCRIRRFTKRSFRSTDVCISSGRSTGRS